jgi:hypothetical protein
MAKRRTTLAALVLMLCLVVGFVAKLNADETAAEVKRAELVTAAKKAYESKEADFKNFRCLADEVYVWSRRLMQAEQLQGTNANAAAEHLTRMRDLNDFVLDLEENNPQRAGTIHLQTKYYLLEAEIGQATK